MKTVASRHNLLFKRVRDAIREHAAEIVIEGPKAVDDAIAGGWKPIAVIRRADGVRAPRPQPPGASPGGLVPPYKAAARGRAAAAGEACPERSRRGAGTPSEVELSAELFASLAETKTSQGVIGLFERPRFAAADLFAHRNAIVVALDAVQDPGNVGTIIRLAAAFDAAGVVLLPGC